MLDGYHTAFINRTLASIPFEADERRGWVRRCDSLIMNDDNRSASNTVMLERYDLTFPKKVPIYIYYDWVAETGRITPISVVPDEIATTMVQYNEEPINPK